MSCLQPYLWFCHPVNTNRNIDFIEWLPWLEPKIEIQVKKLESWKVDWVLCFSFLVVSHQHFLTSHNTPVGELIKFWLWYTFSVFFFFRRTYNLNYRGKRHSGVQHSVPTVTSPLPRPAPSDRSRRGCRSGSGFLLRHRAPSLESSPSPASCVLKLMPWWVSSVEGVGGAHL